MHRRARRTNVKSSLSHQQGDVLLFAVDTIPDGAKVVPRKNGRLILAEGEATGHAHAISDPGATLYSMPDGTLYLEVTGEVVPLEHEEHKAHHIKRKRSRIYRVGKVREMDPFESEIRQVRD